FSKGEGFRHEAHLSVEIDVPDEPNVKQQVRGLVPEEVAHHAGADDVRDDVILVSVCFRWCPHQTSKFIRLRDFHAATAAEVIEPNPPTITDNGAPIAAANSPASSSPNCGPPMKNIMLIDVMRPRRWFGVTNCRIVCRNTVLTVSAAPVTASINNENQNTVETPNAAVAKPKIATETTTNRPSFRKLPMRAITSAVITDPIAGAAASKP